jgi:predicted RNA-binding Zn-ribbon protein involved in translation (DUF1610 family)
VRETTLTRRCSNCGGECLWAIDAWTCSACGDEWVEDHNIRYAPPWSDADEKRIADLRRTRDLGNEYRRLRRLEGLEASRRRGNRK